MVSCTRSSPSEVLRVIRQLTAYRVSRWARSCTSKEPSPTGPPEVAATSCATLAGFLLKKNGMSVLGTGGGVSLFLSALIRGRLARRRAFLAGEALLQRLNALRKRLDLGLEGAHTRQERSHA